jgi:hypothetical protein
LEVFERLLAVGPQPGRESVYVAQESSDFFDWRRQKFIERTVARYTDHARRVVAELEAAWGPPRSAGEVEETPETEWAYWRGFRWMACWSRGEALAFVAVSHEDKELPVERLFGVEDTRQAEPGAAPDTGPMTALS